MKGIIFVLILASGLSASAVLASDVNLGINLNIGNSPPPSGAPIAVEEPPQFIMPQSLGFYVAVGMPFDMFYVANRYYVYRGNQWYYGLRYNGPWHMTSYQQLPVPLRRHQLDRIRHYRDEEYRVYSRDREHYRGRHYRPEYVGKERHGDRDGRDDRGEGREREYRHEGHGHGDR